MPRDEAQIIDDRPADKRGIVLWAPEKIGGYNRISWGRPTLGLISRFQQVLEDAKDERPLQTFFEEFPQALLTGLVRPHGGWVVPKPRIQIPGRRPLEPDFIVCEWSSVGPDWFIVELENPTKRPLLENGDTSRILNHAINQVTGYRSALEEHGHFIRESGWPKLHGKFSGVVVIGRRKDTLREEYRDRLREFRHNNIEVMSYDRLFEHFKEFQEFIEENAVQAAALKDAVQG